MKEGRIRPSLQHPFPPPGYLRSASMKEGRIRPSLPAFVRLAPPGFLSLNEGGSNSTLVATSPQPPPAAPACLNEGGSNSTLVAAGRRAGAPPTAPASMKEGRIRPSLSAAAAKCSAAAAPQ